MSQATDGPPRALDQYREYLRLLAGLQTDPRSGPPIEPSDLVQQTLLQAHRHLGTFRGMTDGEFRAWLRAILAQQLAQAARRQRPGEDRVRSLEEALDQSSARLEGLLTSRESSPSHGAMRTERLVELTAALARLPTEQRTAVELRYLGGLSVAEVAARMGRSPVSVTGLIYRGTKALRGLMGEIS